MIQCDYLMLKDVAGTGGLKVLSMYVGTFGYRMSTVVEMKGPTDMFATMWAVKMMNFLELSDIILQCDPEPSLIKWAESVKSKRTETSNLKFSQTVTSKQWRSRKLSETVAGTSANNAGSNARTPTIQTICRQRTRGSFLVSEVVRYSPHSIAPWADRTVENWWSLEKQFLHIFQRSEKDLEIQHQSWQTDGNPACGWERATSQTNTLSEQMME